MSSAHGIYRRIYGGFLDGRRINSVSMCAEAWFWRLHALADDFGNLPADARWLAPSAAPRRRDVSPEQAETWLQELVAIRLVSLYEVDDRRYAHIIGFEALQPAGKNGRRIQKNPLHPPESDPATCDGGTLGILGNPKKSSPSHTHTHTHTQTHSHVHTHTQNPGREESGGRAERPQGDSGKAGGSGQGKEADEEGSIYTGLLRAGVNERVARELSRHELVRLERVLEEIRSIKRAKDIRSPVRVLVNRLQRITKGDT